MSSGLAPDPIRYSGRFPPPQEEAYHTQKFEELRPYTWRTLLTLPPLILGLWLWHWSIDPAAAPSTFAIRIGMASCLLPALFAIRRPTITAARFTLVLYLTVLATQVFWMWILRRLASGMIYGIGGYMYYV